MSYVKKEFIGEGAFGQVWRVRKGSSDFAMKVLDWDKSAESELKLLVELNHPNIVTLVEAEGGSGELHLIMEWADQGTMTNFVEKYSHPPSKWRQNRGSPARCQDVLDQLSRALKYLHGKRVMHRDLKPDNILGFGSRAPITWKLADFGISKLIKSDKFRQYMAATRIGTPNYVAPEVIQGREYSFPADVFSLGAVLFFYCNGVTHLFKDENDVLRWSGWDLDIHSSYPDSLKWAILRMLNPNPSKRRF